MTLKVEAKCRILSDKCFKFYREPNQNWDYIDKKIDSAINR